MTGSNLEETYRIRHPDPVADEDDHTPPPAFPVDARPNALDELRDHIDVARVPFTERGSRVLVLREEGQTGLSIRLAERWAHLEKTLGNYQRRRAEVDGLQPLDGEGRPLSFGLTTWPHQLRLTPEIGGFDLAFLDSDTLLVQLPAGRAGLRFTVAAEKVATDWRGGIASGHFNLAYTARGPVVLNEVKPAGEGRVEVKLVVEGGEQGAVTLNLTSSRALNRGVPPAALAFEAAERRWSEWFAATPPVEAACVRPYYYAWYVMRAALLSPRGYLTREGMVPSKTRYLGVWHWDALFHALAYRHVDRRLAEDQLRLLLDYQLDNGMIPDVVHDEGIIVRDDGANSALTKPPLMAWAALKLYESGSDTDFLAEVYDPVARWTKWWFATVHYWPAGA